MKIDTSKNLSKGYVAGDSFLHNLQAETKILVSLLLLLGSGVGGGGALILVGLLSGWGAFVAAVPIGYILNFIRRMAWFFIAIAVFPVLFTPGFLVPLPIWFPFSISYEGLVLGLESSLRLLNILLISLVMVRTTSSEDWMTGMKKLLGPVSQRFPLIKDLFAVAALSVQFLPILVAETEEHFTGFGNKDIPVKGGYKKVRAAVLNVLQFIAGIFSDIDRFQRIATSRRDDS